MTRAELGKSIKDQLDGIQVQWMDIAGEDDPIKRAGKKDAVFASMDIVGDMMRRYWSMNDDA